MKHKRGQEYNKRLSQDERDENLRRDLKKSLPKSARTKQEAIAMIWGKQK